jgi:hypothetical protein
MLTASSDLAVTTQQGDRRAQYWAFFTQDEMALWHFIPLGQEDMKTASAPVPSTNAAAYLRKRADEIESERHRERRGGHNPSRVPDTATS